MARKAAKGKTVTPKTTSESATGAQGLESGVSNWRSSLGGSSARCRRKRMAGSIAKL